MYRSETLKKMNLKMRSSAASLNKDTLRSAQLETTTNVHKLQTSRGSLQFSVTRRPGTKRNMDTSLLTTTRLPDLQPAVAPDSYLRWRYMNQRGSTQASFDKCLHNLKERAQVAINQFQLQLDQEEKRQKKQRVLEREQLKEYQEKVTKSRANWTTVQGKQAVDADQRLTRSNNYYNRSLKDIKKRFEIAEIAEVGRSRDHQQSIQSAREKRTQVSVAKSQREENRVAKHLTHFTAAQQLHYERADSARSERVSILNKSNADWELKLEDQLVRQSSKVHTDFEKDIARQQKTEQFIKNKGRNLKTTAKSFHERLCNEQRSFSAVSKQNSSDRAQFVKKVEDKHDRISEQSQKVKEQIVQAQTQFRDYNTMRVTENMKGQVQEKAVLTSIKERVWKNHKNTQQRRRRQLKEVAPPSTYEIYTCSKNSLSMRSNFQLVSPRQPKPDPNVDPSTVKPVTQYTPCNLRNPLQDYSMRLAMSQTQSKNPFKLKQMKVQSLFSD